MKFKLIVDRTKEEEVVVTAHERSPLTDRLEALVLEHTDRIPAYTEDDVILLPVSEIECITILDGRTYAIDSHNRRLRLKQRLYELEAVLPTSFIRINKSTLANETKLERFTAAFNGAVDAGLRCGYREYVSRRCFSEIKRRFDQR